MNTENSGYETTDSAPDLDAALLLSWATSSLDTTVGSSLSRVGISLDDFRRLRAIGAHPQGLNRENLAEVMGETRSHTVRSSLPLVKLGWLSRPESGEFMLTDSGRALIDQAEGIAGKAAERWFADIGISPRDVIAAVGRTSNLDPQTFP